MKEGSAAFRMIIPLFHATVGQSVDVGARSYVEAGLAGPGSHVRCRTKSVREEGSLLRLNTGPFHAQVGQRRSLRQVCRLSMQVTSGNPLPVPLTCLQRSLYECHEQTGQRIAEADLGRDLCRASGEGSFSSVIDLSLPSYELRIRQLRELGANFHAACLECFASLILLQCSATHKYIQDLETVFVHLHTCWQGCDRKTPNAVH
jgi:hypothetical protein